MEELIAQGEISRRIYRIRRFPDDFMFVLTEVELDNVVSQFVIPSRLLKSMTI